MPGPDVLVNARAPAHPAPHPHGRDFILGLHHREGLAPVLSDPEAVEIAFQAFAQAAAGGDGIPGDDVDTAVHQPQRRGRVSVDDDLALVSVHGLNAVTVALLEIFLGPLIAVIQRGHVDVDGLLLACKLLPQGLLDFIHVDAEELRAHSYVQHVDDQLAQAHLLAALGDHLLEGHGVMDAVRALVGEPERLLVNQHRAFPGGFDILIGGLRVHAHQDVGVLLAGDPAVPVGANGEPRRQPLDVARKQVLAADGDPHAEQRPQQHHVAGLAARAVGGGDVQD